jgi:hypothetical protein
MARKTTNIDGESWANEQDNNRASTATAQYLDKGNMLLVIQVELVINELV